MATNNEKKQIKSRNEEFTTQISSRIWDETPSETNPYIAASARCYGYDITEIFEKSSFPDTIFLLLKGELPNEHQSELFSKTLISLINPGPRHPATRAAMNAGVGKTNPEHILPISLSILSGEYHGATEVSNSMQFIKSNRNKNIPAFVESLISNNKDTKVSYDHLAPGFGRHFGGIDILPNKFAAMLSALPGAGQYLEWGSLLSRNLNQFNYGWLTTGVAAAVFLDLGFHPRAGSGIFQLASSAGLLAHGLELANKPRTAMPFLKDENYIIEKRDPK